MKPIVERTHPMGIGTQRIYRFPNGYGASVVCTPYTYGGGSGLWELGVVRFTGEGPDEYELAYDTPVSADVIGYLTDAEVEPILKAIKKLPKEASDVGA